MRRLLRTRRAAPVAGWLVLLLFTLPWAARAHVGSPGVVFEGQAGQYRVLITVQPPDVVPGTANVQVSVEGRGVRRVTVQPIYWYSGDEGAPAPETATAVAGAPGQYQGLVWFMETGTASVQVTVEGADGTGQVLVPVVAVATARRQMPPALGWGLAGLAALLFTLMVTAVGAAVGDGTVAPGVAPLPHQRRKQWTGMAITAAVCAIILLGGSYWWRSWATNYERVMYHPLTATTTVQPADNANQLTLRVDTASLRGVRLSYVIPDHGKLMHLFLVRQGTLDVFAHLHPQRHDTVTFTATLPPLPAGRYLLFADIVRRNGFANTIADTVDIPAPRALAPATPRDSEDTYLTTNPLQPNQPTVADQGVQVCGAPGVKTALPDGSAMVWEETRTLTAGQVYPLTFVVLAPDGQPAVLQPYLGMRGHAAVLRDDGQVFIHLHPTGTYSMATQQVLESRVADTTVALPTTPDPRNFRDSVDRLVARPDAPAALISASRPLMGHAMDTAQSTSMVSFPYAFPQAGHYRIWVQIKRDGKIMSGAFDALVKAPR